MKGVFSRFLLIIALCVASVQASQAQFDDERIDTSAVDNDPKERERKKFDPKGIFVGLNYSMGLGRSLFFEFAPYVGYRFFDLIAVGAGVPYMLIYNPSFNAASHIFGARAFVRIRPAKETFFSQFYVHGEAEYLKMYLANPNYNPSIINGATNRYNVQAQPAVHVGIGYCNNFTNGLSATVEFLYNILYTRGSNAFNSPFSYRLGLMYNF